MKKLILSLAALSLVAPAIAVPEDDYSMKFTVTIADGVGEKTATGAVIPIFLDESKINGFHYSDFQEDDCTDLYITDNAGNACSYEIDMVNKTGTTTVWVKAPSIAKRNVFSVYYGGPKNTGNVPTAVWSNFLGVWHFNEISTDGTSAAAYEATGNASLAGYDTPMTTSVDNGKFGRARQPRSSDAANNKGVGGIFLPPMTLNSQFAISGWFNCVNSQYTALFSTKQKLEDPGFNCFLAGRITHIEFCGDSHTNWNSAATGLDVLNTWNRFCMVTDGSHFDVYSNGTKTGRGNQGTSTVTDNGNEIAVGHVPTAAAKQDQGTGSARKDGATADAARSWVGQIDEIRIQSYSNFDENREYFEGALAFDPSLSVYSPAASSTALEVDLVFTVVRSKAPGEITFTALVPGASGSCTYEWDFDNDGTIDRTGSNASETWTCPKPGKYHARVHVTDGDGTEGEITTMDTFTINDTYYADSAAAAGGDGSATAPFNNLADLFAALNDGDDAKLRGTFAIGDQTSPLVIPVSDFTLSSWDANAKASLVSTNLTKKASGSILKVAGSNVTLRDLSVSLTKESCLQIAVFNVAGANVTFDNCDFEISNGPFNFDNPTSDYGTGKGFIATDSNDCTGLRVQNCTFTGYRGGNSNVNVLFVHNHASIVNCKFDGVSKLLTIANAQGSGLVFVSNIVLNAENKIVDSNKGGVLFSGGWNYLSGGATIAFNCFVNDPQSKAGCVAYFNSKTGQSGVIFNNNTVVGYDSFIRMQYSQPPYYFYVFNNLFQDVDYVMHDTSEQPQCIGNNNKTPSEARNNVYTGAMLEAPEGYDTTGKLVIDSNTQATATFVSLDPESDDFCRVAGSPAWINDAYTTGGYPEYIGAIDPTAAPPGPEPEPGVIMVFE